jgi:hypothetical protein
MPAATPRQTMTVLSRGSSDRLRPLAAAAVLLLGSVSFGLTPSRAEDPSGDPIGILLAAGDITGCKQTGSKHAEMAAQIQKEIADAKGLPVGVLVLGDVAYADYKGSKPVPGTYQSCFETFTKTWGVHKDQLFPVPGNHDYSDDVPKAAKKPTPAKLYKEYFAGRIAELKTAGGGDSKDNKLSFATRFPGKDDWLLAGIDRYDGDAEPAKRLAKQLAASPARCVLVFTHPFYVSSGDHGGGDGPSSRMAQIMSVLYDKGATMLVAGHDHSLEQFPKVDGTGKPDGAKGVRSFVVGTGGATLYPEYTKHPLSEHFANKSRGFLKLILHRDGYKWSFVQVAGSETCNRKP